MASNSLVQILEFQNQIQDLEERLKPFIEANPYDPEVVKLRLDLAYQKGKLEAHLEFQEILHK